MTNMPKKPAKSKKAPASGTRGPKPEMFKIEGLTFDEAVKKSFEKKKPPGGWPK